jgi:3-oxoacyl-[acyl-carrier-protein] synthase-1
MYRVAITGIGIISSLGNDIDTVGESLRLGKSGIAADEKRVGLGFRSPLTGIIRGFDPRDFLAKKYLKSMPDFAAQAYAASLEALRISGLGQNEIQSDQTGLVFGCDSSALAAIEQVDLLKLHGETKSIGSGLVFRSMTSTVTMNLNTLLKTRGACWSISSACSSGGHAVGQAADLIMLGRQERIICGGAQEINWESICGFDALGAFSTRIDKPEAASRPFDKDRDGLVPGGGAAALILERYDLAEKRGVPILGELASYGFSSDGDSLSVPSRCGIASAMKMSLKNAHLKACDIDYICAHATSTPIGDAVEAAAILEVFGEHKPYVSSLKSMTGHELWMSGASQVVYSVIMAMKGFIAPNINFDNPDESSERLNVVKETIHRPPRTVLCTSAGFGGTNSCLIVRFAL